MEFPVFSLVRFGRLRAPNRLHTPPDEIGSDASCYELEFYYEDSPGGLTIDFPATIPAVTLDEVLSALVCLSVK